MSDLQARDFYIGDEVRHQKWGVCRVVFASGGDVMVRHPEHDDGWSGLWPSEKLVHDSDGTPLGEFGGISESDWWKTYSEDVIDGGRVEALLNHLAAINAILGVEE